MPDCYGQPALFLTTQNSHMRKDFMQYLLYIGIATVFLVGLIWYMTSGKVKPTRYIEGNITYLVFKTSNSIAVVNYTQDSLEYEFLHSPTKTYHDTATSAGLIYSSNGVLKEVR